jgi:hypothetical protein
MQSLLGSEIDWRKYNLLCISIRIKPYYHTSIRIVQQLWCNCNSMFQSYDLFCNLWSIIVITCNCGLEKNVFTVYANSLYTTMSLETLFFSSRTKGLQYISLDLNAVIQPRLLYSYIPLSAEALKSAEMGNLNKCLMWNFFIISSVRPSPTISFLIYLHTRIVRGGRSLTKRIMTMAMYTIEIGHIFYNRNCRNLQRIGTISSSVVYLLSTAYTPSYHQTSRYLSRHQHSYCRHNRDENTCLEYIDIISHPP